MVPMVWWPCGLFLGQLPTCEATPTLLSSYLDGISGNGEAVIKKKNCVGGRIREGKVLLMEVRVDFEGGGGEEDERK